MLEQQSPPIEFHLDHMERAIERIPADDLYDAAAAAWSALRIQRDKARCLPEDPRPGEPTIWY